MRVMENANQLQSSVRRLLKSIYEEQKLKSKQIECVRRHIAYIFLLVFTVNATMLSSEHYSLLSCGTLRSLEEIPSSQLVLCDLLPNACLYPLLLPVLGELVFVYRSDICLDNQPQVELEQRRR